MSVTPHKVAGTVIAASLSRLHRTIDQYRSYSQEVSGMLGALERRIEFESSHDPWKRVHNGDGASFATLCSMYPTGYYQSLITSDTWYYNTGTNDAGGQVGYTIDKSQVSGHRVCYVEQSAKLMPFKMVILPCETLVEERRDGKVHITIR